MQTKEVWPYYECLKKKSLSLAIKRGFDIFAAGLALIILLPIFIAISIGIVIDSKGGVFFKQERVTQYGRSFHIFKFRTMIVNAESFGSQVTSHHDIRITKIGRTLRKYRLDELPQLINIIKGDMSFVGTRPEVPRFVNRYTAEMFATLLLPAGVTSKASIQYKDEDQLLEGAKNIDETYIHQILPEKMKYNLESIKEFSFMTDLKIIIKTIFTIIR